MKQYLFANRIHRVYFSGGAVVIEFCVLRPDQNGEVHPDAAVGENDVPFAVALPLAGLMRSIGELRKTVEELTKKGILKKPEGDQRNDRMRRQGELKDITERGDGDDPLI